MKVCESQAIAGQLVQIWCSDFAAEAAEIAETQVVCYNDKEVGPLALI